MLTVFHGTDTFKSRQELQKALKRIEGGSTVLRYDELSLTKETLEDALGAQGLFGGATVVVLDSVLDDELLGEEVLSRMEAMQMSPNVFFLIVGRVDAKTAKSFEAHAECVVRSDLSEDKKKDSYGPFQLADAFLRRDRKTAWVLFTEASMRGTSAQEIAGTLVWQMRVLVLAYSTASAKEAGVSDFPYRKAKSGMKFFTRKEAEDMLSRLVGMYHFDPKENRGDLMIALERVILGL